MADVREIEITLLDFIRREVFAPEIELTLETDLIAAGSDSMSLVRVLLFIETSHGFWIPQGEINTSSLQNIRRNPGSGRFLSLNTHSNGTQTIQ